MKATARIDLAALKAAAERPDSSHALVERHWLRDVYRALCGDPGVELLPCADDAGGHRLGIGHP